MFGKRSDGKELKNTPAFFKIVPMIMKERSDSQVFFNQDIAISAINNYIENKAKEGIKLSILDIIFAAVVRILNERPILNRFAINGRIYSRNTISVSLAIKKSLTDEGEETTLKVLFDGTENLFEVHDKLHKIISENKDLDAKNGTDKTASFLAKIPIPILKFAIGFIKHLDNTGHLPKSLINISPFHTSAFITNVGSIGIDSIYHHLYNFGTTSMFFAIGKKKKSYVFTDDEIKEERCINLAFVGDERICDGYYFAHSFKILNKYLQHPELLETGLQEKIKDPGLVK